MAVIRVQLKGQAKIAYAEKVVNKAGGKFFGAGFIKKDNTLREGQFRTGVKVHTKGGELKYNPRDFGLRGVWEANNKEGCTEGEAFRMMNYATLTYLRTGGDEYIFLG